MLQKGSVMSFLEVRISNSLRKSSVFWVLSGSFVGCSLGVFVMHITYHIMWWISLHYFSTLKKGSLKMSSKASSSRRNRRRLPEGAPDHDWSKLPLDVLGTIVTMLGTLTDSCRFLTVKNNELPRLVVPEGGDIIKARRGINQETAIDVDIDIDIDEDRRSCGSSHGWWISMDIKSTWFTLLNPCSNMMVDVPVAMKDAINLENAAAVNVNEYFFIIKAVLSADPWFHANDWGMMVIFGDMGRLALYVSRTKSWTFFDPTEFRDFHDVIFYMGKFYLVDAYSLVYSCDINDLTIVQVAGPPEEEPRFLIRNYLVESPEGDLLQIWRWLVDDENAPGKPYKTKGFQAFKLKQEEEGWEKLNELKGMAVYLGDNHGISVKVSDYPGDVKADKIYFTMECCDVSKTGWREACMPRDVGSYDLKRKRLKWRALSDDNDEFRQPHPPSIWLIPTLGANPPDFIYDFADR